MMMFIQLLALAVMAFVQLQFASAAAVKSVEARVAPVDAQLPAGYEIQVPSFAGIANGVNFNISGTIEDVLLELERIHPGIDILAPGVLTGSAANETTLAAGPNEKSTPMDLYCIPVGGQPWNPVTQGSVDKNRQLLYRLSFVNVGINPRSCARLACSDWPFGSIWICSDNNWVIYIPMSTIADRAGVIQRRCDFPGYWTGGQEFYYDGWNTIIRGGC